MKDKAKGFNINICSSDKNYIFISLGYSNSQVTPKLISGYKPIHISRELPGVTPENFFFIKDNEEGLRTPRGNYTDFYNAILESKTLKNVFSDLIKRQGELPVKTFQNHHSLSPLFEREGIFSFGLTPEESQKYNDKVYQVNLLKNDLPYPKHQIVTPKESEKYFDRLQTNKGVFIALRYGGAGSGTFIAKTKDEFNKISDKQKPNEEFIMAECLSLVASPSIDVLIANPEEVIAYGLIDQIFNPINPLGCYGNIFPSKLEPKTQERIKELAILGGKKLAEDGLRGYVSFDFNVDTDNQVYFGEINARYAGSTSDRMTLMELTRPNNHPRIMDLEEMAIRESSFCGYNIWEEPKDTTFIRRETYAESDGEVILNTPFPQDQLEVFKNQGVTIVGALENGAKFKKGTTLGKIVAVDNNEPALSRKIKEMENHLKKSIRYHQ